jgi:uncharacterized protein YlaI
MNVKCWHCGRRIKPFEERITITVEVRNILFHESTSVVICTDCQSKVVIAGIDD